MLDQLLNPLAGVYEPASRFRDKYFSFFEAGSFRRFGLESMENLG